MTIAELEAECEALGITRINVRGGAQWTLTLSRAHVIAVSVQAEQLDRAFQAALTFLRNDVQRRRQVSGVH